MGQTGRLTEISSYLNGYLTLVIIFACFKGSTYSDTIMTLRTQYWARKPYSGVCNAEFLGMPTDVRVISVEVFLQGENRAYTLTKYGVYKSDKVKSWKFIPSGYWYDDYDKDYIEPFTLNIEIPQVRANYNITCQVAYTHSTGHMASSVKRRELVSLEVHPRGSENPCQDGWMYFEVTDQCIKLFHEEKSWGDAQEYCNHYHKAELVVIGGREFDDKLTGMTGIKKGSSHWIGLSAKGRTYKWVTGGTTPNFRNWGGYSPVTGGDKCVEKGRGGNGIWSLQNCTLSYRFICQRSKDMKSLTQSFIYNQTVIYILLVILVTLLMASILLCLFVGIVMKATPEVNKAILAPVKKLVKKEKQQPQVDNTEDDEDSPSPVFESNRPATSGHVVILYDSVLNDVVSPEKQACYNN